MEYAAYFALALTLFAVSVSRAADKGLPGNYEHLKEFEPRIGTCTGEFVAEYDHPTANVKKGDKLIHTLSFQWDLIKSVIVNRNTMAPPGADPIWESTWLIGWDTENKRIVAYAFETTGGHGIIDRWE